MSLKKKIISLSLSASLILGSMSLSFADSVRVVTLGANLNESQRETMLNYFGVNENEVLIIEVNNQEERKYLEGVATEAQIGNKTFSCAYVEPTKAGSGINVKIANLTWLTSSMVATTLSTAGLTDADVVAGSVIPVSGTGALTGIMKAFEDASGEPLEEDKKELASEELVVTGGLGEDENIGPDKATGIVNDIKTEIIKNDTKDTIQIAETIVNVTNNYNVTLTDEQQKQLEDLMAKVSEQDYNYNEMKDTLNGIKDDIDDKLEELGESVNKGFFDTISGWFEGIGEWFSNLLGGSEDLGILGSTNDDALGDNAIIDATDKDAVNTTPSDDAKEDKNIFAQIWDWFIGLFDGNSDENVDNNESNDSSTDENTNEEDNPSEENTNDNTLDNNTDDNTDNNIDDNSTEDNTDTNLDDNSNVNTPDSENNTENLDNVVPNDEESNPSDLDTPTSSDEQTDLTETENNN